MTTAAWASGPLFFCLGGAHGNHKYHAAAHGQGPNYEAGPFAEQKSTGHAVSCFFVCMRDFLSGRLIVQQVLDKRA